MNEEKRRILDMLAAGKINAEEAERLLDALVENSSPLHTDKPENTNKRTPKYLHVQIQQETNSSPHDAVNVKVPILLLKTGMKLKSFMPKNTQGKISEHLHKHGINIDLDNMDDEQLDNLLTALMDTSIDIESEHEKIRVFCA